MNALKNACLFGNIKHFMKLSIWNCSNRRWASTIYALSSGVGKCGVAVVRVSGPGVKKALTDISGFKQLPAPRIAELRKIRDPITKELLDKGLVFWFPGPRSFTGEDCCEFHVHGSTAVVSALLNALGKLEHFRPAEPGEFTRRAFYSGKLDLPAVEGLAALVHSETEVQRKHALYQMSGALSNLYMEWTQSLMKSLAHLEAHIDFDEDQDIDKDVLNHIQQDIRHLISAIKVHLEDGRRGERIREGVEMTILGAPNSGKSSLLNILSRKPTAIVSSIPGTTRDVVRTHLDLNGYPVNISDTAGLRDEPSDEVEEEGMSRAVKAAFHSDLILLLLDCSLFPLSSRESFLRHLRDWVHTGASRISTPLARCHNLCPLLGLDHQQPSAQGLIILNKADLLPSQYTIQSTLENMESVILISCKTEFGIDELLKEITKHLKQLCGSSLVGFSKPYQRHSLENCLSHLLNYLHIASSQPDLSAEQLRLALTCLGKLTGKVSPEQLLDIIFKDFCIGK